MIKKTLLVFWFFCRSNISDFEITNIDDNMCIINSPISKNTRNIEWPFKCMVKMIFESLLVVVY